MTPRLPTIHGITEHDVGPYRMERLDLEFGNGERRRCRFDSSTMIVRSSMPTTTAPRSVISARRARARSSDRPRSFHNAARVAGSVTNSGAVSW